MKLAFDYQKLPIEIVMKNAHHDPCFEKYRINMPLATILDAALFSRISTISFSNGPAQNRYDYMRFPLRL